MNRNIKHMKVQVLDPFSNMVPKPNKKPELKPIIAHSHRFIFHSRSAESLRQKPLEILSPVLQTIPENHKFDLKSPRVKLKIAPIKLSLPQIRIRTIGGGTSLRSSSGRNHENIKKIEFNGTFGFNK